MTENPGTLVQLMMRDDFYIALFGMIQETANNWGGSEPCRPIRLLLEELH